MLVGGRSNVVVPNPDVLEFGSNYSGTPWALAAPNPDLAEPQQVLDESAQVWPNASQTWPDPCGHHLEIARDLGTTNHSTCQGRFGYSFALIEHPARTRPALENRRGAPGPRSSGIHTLSGNMMPYAVAGFSQPSGIATIGPFRAIYVTVLPTRRGAPAYEGLPPFVRRRCVEVGRRIPQQPEVQLLVVYQSELHISAQ